ncbi:MAG: AI-2 transport protein TqsA [Myxococcota bacterium]|jgi:AI-2 transport protein TqsA
MTEPKGNAPRIVVTIAALMVIVAGLQYASEILLPLLFAVFLSIVALPVVGALRRVGLPNGLAIAVVVLAVAGALVGASAGIAGTVRSFSAALPRYEGPFQELVQNTLAQLETSGIRLEGRDLSQYLSPNAIMAMVGQTVNAVVGILARVLIVTVTMTFILLEASELTRKLRVALGDGAEGGLVGALSVAGAQVQRYLLIKTSVSAVTGLLAGLWCNAMGVDFPLLWGTLAFLLNYIPSIGSIVAAVPPILLGTVQHGPFTAVAVLFGYIIINVALGNFLEPRLLGRSLGLSPLVVFVSLLFWGWVWGPVGMLFCVPMTVIFKIVLENYGDTRWLAVLLGPAREIDRFVGSAAPTPIMAPRLDTPDQS